MSGSGRKHRGSSGQGAANKIAASPHPGVAASVEFISRVARAAGKRASALHHDTRGAISVLTLLMIWCLVALMGMVWNTAEESTRRAQVQTAADSAAHASAIWMARAVNTIDAQNMVICQDASTEAIWRAVPPTDQGIKNRLNGEIARANQMELGQTVQNALMQIENQIQSIAAEYQFTTDALSALAGGSGANYANPQEALQTRNAVRQAASALNWVNTTYVNGSPPGIGAMGAPPRPGPPGPNGQGLVQLVEQWKPAASQNQILEMIKQFITSNEMPVDTAFENRTQPATSQAVDQQMEAHEAQVYQEELTAASGIPDAVELQRQQLASMYGTDLTLATPQNNSGSAVPAHINPPVVPASSIAPVTGHTDSIRAAYPAQAAAANLDVTVDIDPINPQTDAAEIWHPDMPAPVPASFLAQYKGLAPSYNVPGNAIGGWGHVYAMPLEHYLLTRVDMDEQTLQNGYMVPLDNLRTQTLAQQIRQMLGLPTTGQLNIANLPAQIPDDQPEPQLPQPPPQRGGANPPPPPPVFNNIWVLPQLTAPLNASAAYRTQVANYNQHGAAFTAAVRSLRSMILNYTNIFQYFTTAFAVTLWQNNINTNAALVLDNLGQGKQFMVLASYNLSPLPSWAVSGMQQSAESAVENQIMTVSARPIIRAITTSLSNSNPNNLASGVLDQTTRQAILTAGYADTAAAVADAILRPAAQQIAAEVAAEWITRPWAYEIAPPVSPAPPFHGIASPDRLAYFTVLAAAEQTPATAPRLMLTKLLGTDSNSLVAYAQAEAYNWNEFNTSGGGNDRYDQVVNIPEVVYQVGGITGLTYSAFTGEPRGGRTASIGGWDWRSRLSLSDGLYPALQSNPDFNQMLQDAGMKEPDSGALDAINLH